MDDETTDKRAQIVEEFRQALRFSGRHYALLSAAMVATAFWFAGPLLFGRELPLWVPFVVAPFVGAWTIIGFLRYRRTTLEPRFEALGRDWGLAMRSLMLTFVPTAELRRIGPWLSVMLLTSLGLLLAGAIAGLIGFVRIARAV